jgi:hypothetical protein
MKYHENCNGNETSRIIVIVADQIFSVVRTESGYAPLFCSRRARFFKNYYNHGSHKAPHPSKFVAKVEGGGWVDSPALTCPAWGVWKI